MEKSVHQKKEELLQKTFRMMFRILLTFGIPAGIAYGVGKWLDTTYDIRPYGTLAVLAIAFVSSWALVIRMYLQMSKEAAAIQQEEEEQRAAYQHSLTES